jgi:mono/diheme cytochrome c family protein
MCNGRNALKKNAFSVSKWCTLLLAVLIGWSSISFAQDTASAAAGGLSTDAAVIDKGKGIFAGNCAQCHAVNKQVVGPALAGVYDRQTIPWLINFIKYPEKTIKSGDAHAVELYNKYKQYMPNHDFLSDEEIIAVLSYVQDHTKNPSKYEKAPENPNPDPNPTQEADSSPLLLVIIGILVTLLVVVLAVMIALVSVLSKYLTKKDGLTSEDKDYIKQKFSIFSVLKSSAFVGTVTFLFIAFALKAVVDGMFSVGIQQGYAPEQPIKFSHKLHAGYYEIDCKYCHTGVEKGKQANIPSANICMNCHNSIKTTSPEIQKIYAAVENDEPIQWVRIHNLPDLAYFNHAQHVKVAGLDCENCHGNIKEMEIVQQYSLLTMGWCVDCHRKTEVKTKGNAYYDKLVQLHADKSKKPMVVEDIGGLECAKCHY